MTLTKYQRGDLMEGWNDCPSFMLKNVSSVTVNTSLCQDSETEKETEIHSIDITQIIDQLTEFPTKASERMIDQIKQKLQSVSSQLLIEQKLFISSVLNQLQNGTEKSHIKQQIIDYMMVNDNVTSWCSPLKTLVTNSI